jgi:hypothetical protein
MYYHQGARMHRDYFISALRMVYRKPTLEVGLPSAGRVSVIHQSDRRRYVVHLLYGPPLQRGSCLVIEDLPALHDLPVALRVPQKIKRARQVVAGKSLKISRAGGAVRANVVEFACHEAIVFEY